MEKVKQPEQFVVPPGADEAQSFRVPVPLPEDPYEAIRQAYLDGTDTESEHFKDPIDTETPETHVCCACFPPAMSSVLSSSMAEVAAMSESAFRKRFRSSHKSSPSSSSPDLPARKRYRGMFELVEDSEEDDDEEIEESLDSNNVSEDAEDKGPTTEDEDPAAGDEGLAARVQGLSTDDESYSLDGKSHGMDYESCGLDDEGHSIESDGLGLEEEEEVVPEALEEDHVYSTFEVGRDSGSAPESERPKRVPASRQPTLTTWTDLEDGMVYVDVPAYLPPAPPVQTPPSPYWELKFRCRGRLIRDHVVRLEDLSPALFERYFTRLGAVRDKILSHRYRFRSLEYEQERVAVTFRAIWRPLLALESWAGQTDAQRAALWHQSPEEVIQAAAKLGCLVLKCPFYYLGTRVGGSMTRVQAWQEIVEKFQDRRHEFGLAPSFEIPEGYRAKQFDSL
ncbi:hypothetical protein Tco_0812812 [Tanacetum coccineum]